MAHFRHLLIGYEYITTVMHSIVGGGRFFQDESNNKFKNVEVLGVILCLTYFAGHQLNYYYKMSCHQNNTVNDTVLHPGA